MNIDAEGSHEPSQGSSNPYELPILRSDSYTAMQLCFLTPEIMHTESRVLLIGSIPDNIGRSSRTSGRRELLALVDARRKAWREMVGRKSTDQAADTERPDLSEGLVSSGHPEKLQLATLRHPKKLRNELRSRTHAGDQQTSNRNRAQRDQKWVDRPQSLAYDTDGGGSSETPSFVTALDPDDEAPHRFYTPDYTNSGNSDDSKGTSATAASSAESSPMKPTAQQELDDEDMEVENQRLLLTRTYTNDVPKLESICTNDLQPILERPARHQLTTWQHNKTAVPSSAPSKMLATTPEDQTTPSAATKPTKVEPKLTRFRSSETQAQAYGQPKAQSVAIRDIEPGPIEAPDREDDEVETMRPESLHSTNSSHLTPSSSRASSDDERESVDEPILFRAHMLVQTRQFRKGGQRDLPLANSMRQAITRVDTRWKEHAVALKMSRVTRGTLVLQMATTSKRAVRPGRTRRGVKVKVNTEWSLCFYSALDLTVALWSPRHKHLYIFQCQGMAKRLEFIKLLAQFTHRPGPEKPLLVRFPEEELFVKIPATWEGLSEWAVPPLVSIEMLAAPATSVSPSENALLRFVWSSRRKINREPASDSSVKKYALGWRYRHKLDDSTPRMMWINPIDSEQLHPLRYLLEADYHLEVIRPKTQTRGDQGMVEPPAIEGFCHRYSAWGRGIRNVKRAVTYLHTHNHLVLFTSAAQAEPPPVGDSLFYSPDAHGQPHIKRDVIETDKDPEHEIAPYALDEHGRFEWISRCTCVEDTQWFDSVAILERDRRARIIQKADFAVDLATVTAIETENEQDFRFVLSNKDTIGIHVPSIEIRDVWVRRLRDLVKYWHLRRNADSIRRCTGQIDFQVTPLIKNRSILHQGFLYHKNHKFTTLRSRYCVLTKDCLALYSVHSLVPTVRGHQATTLIQTAETDTGGIPSVAASNAQAGYTYRLSCVLDLKGCYVYSGLLAEDMLLSAVDSHVDPSNPGVWALPRAYEDGWISQDSEEDRCFILWRSLPRHVFKRLRGDRSREEVFLARSAIDRDLWVSALRVAVQARDE